MRKLYKGTAFCRNYLRAVRSFQGFNYGVLPESNQSFNMVMKKLNFIQVRKSAMLITIRKNDSIKNHSPNISCSS
ncbi:hypothetical protein BJX99DRAFT_166786 [Aspergillus californicus]